MFIAIVCDYKGDEQAVSYASFDAWYDAEVIRGDETPIGFIEAFDTSFIDSNLKRFGKLFTFDDVREMVAEKYQSIRDELAHENNVTGRLYA